MKRIRLALVAWSLAALLATAGAQPAVMPDLPVMSLDDLGVYAVGCAYRGQAEHQFPLGWSGLFEDRTGVACEPFGRQHGERAFLMHCPWRNGTGVTFQQFVFDIPAQATRVLLRGATAMRSENVTNSDGVTFRLYANGRKLFDYHQTNDAWRPFEFDFTPERGSKLTVRFEVDPGPKNNPSFDYSLWGNRELVLEGYTPPILARPPPPRLALSNLWSGRGAEVAPPSGFSGRSAVNMSNDVVCFRYTGPDGILE